jgi:hypothetical protein
VFFRLWLGCAALLVKEVLKIAIRQQIDGDELAGLPVAGNLQHRRSGKAAMGKQQIFAEQVPFSAVMVDGTETPESTQLLRSGLCRVNGTSPARVGSTFRPNCSATL